jgi:hypothetical protein
VELVSGYAMLVIPLPVVSTGQLHGKACAVTGTFIEVIAAISVAVLRNIVLDCIVIFKAS